MIQMATTGMSSATSVAACIVCCYFCGGVMTAAAACFGAAQRAVGCRVAYRALQRRRSARFVWAFEQKYMLPLEELYARTDGVAFSAFLAR